MGQDSAHSVSSFGRALKRPASVSLYTAIDTRRPKVRRTSFSSLAPSTPNLSDLDDENDDDEDGAYETSLRHFALRVEALQDSITLPPSGIALPGPTAQRVTAPDYRIALDFGTTYTTIAFAKKGEPQASIHTIDGFLEDRCLSLNGRQVPTESVYIRVPSESATSLTKHRRKTSPVRFRRLHGWEAQRWLETPQPNEELIAHIRRMKLLLDNGTWTQDAKSDAQKQVARLKAHRLVHSERDIIQHILKYYLEHIRKTLARDYGFDDRSSVELTFCVPVCWTSMANAVMSDCIETAMRDSAFGLDRDESGDYSVNLFMVNEAEAGASYALASNASHATIKRKQVFLIIDCGGGTTDLGIYRTMEQHPLRLEREINPPSGAMCGSSDLNERMRALALSDLHDKDYLATDSTIETIVEEDIIPKFENEYKRIFKYRDTTQRFRFRLRALRASTNNGRLLDGQYVLDYADMWNIFKPSLETVRKLMKGQIRSAVAKRIEVDSVVVIGGFGDSPALREYLRICLNELNRQYGLQMDIKFTPANTGAAGIAKGAIMRAQDKQLGPERIPTQSIGIYRHIHWEDGLTAPYMKQRVEKDGSDYLIKNTIHWIVKRGNDPVPRVHRVQFESQHSFWKHTKIWKGEEILFISDTCTEDFWKRGHRYNKGQTKELGRVIFDLTHLKQRHVKEHEDKGLSTRTSKINISVLIEMVIIGRDLRFDVRWPAKSDGELLAASRSSFSVVAAFKPGTE